MGLQKHNNEIKTLEIAREIVKKVLSEAEKMNHYKIITRRYTKRINSIIKEYIEDSGNMDVVRCAFVSGESILRKGSLDEIVFFVKCNFGNGSISKYFYPWSPDGGLATSDDFESKLRGVLDSIGESILEVQRATYS